MMLVKKGNRGRVSENNFENELRQFTKISC